MRIKVKIIIISHKNHNFTNNRLPPIYLAEELAES
jgi:hypothetical protein